MVDMITFSIVRSVVEETDNFATLFNYFYTLTLNTTCLMIGNGQRVVISFKIVFALLSVYFIFTGK